MNTKMNTETIQAHGTACNDHSNRPSMFESELARLALKLFRVFNRGGDAGSEFEYNAQNPRDWERLARYVQSEKWKAR